MIDAVVGDDLASVTGTLRLARTDLDLVDPLAGLPAPADDLTLMRTFPGAPATGEVTWWATGPGEWSFRARLPRRYDDVGWTREALLANGAWYPQPTSAEEPLPVLDWSVRVRLPEGRTGALGDDADQGTLSWTGRADRVPLAVLRRARLTHLSGPWGSVSLLTPGRARRVLVRELDGALAAVVDAPIHGVVVEGKLRRRLVRPGPELAFLSDRAYRVTPPLQRFHRVAVAGGLAAAFAPQPDPFLRDLAGAWAGREHAERLAGIDAGRLLGFFRWVPQVHWLLTDERMPFYADVLERTHPSDRLRDDLTDLLQPHTPGTVVLAQLEDRWGGDAADAVGAAALAGATTSEAEAAADLPAGWLAAWRVPYPEQDWRIDVDRPAGTVAVSREAPTGAPPETAIVRIDGIDHRFTAAPGDRRVWQLEGKPRQVILDPEGHLRQTSRLRDAWPERYMVTLSAGITSINATQGRVFGAATVGLRRAWDTHNLFRGTLYNSFSDLVAARVSWLHQRGPQRVGWTRPHQLTTWTGATLLNPGFAATDGLLPTLGAGMSYAWDTRVASDFPLRGHRVGAFVGAGVVPARAESWGSFGPFGLAVASPHPRHAVAVLAQASVARTNVSHRRLGLAGATALRSLPALPACPTDDGSPCQELFDAVAIVATEYRVAPLRNVSVPLPFAWGSELQLTAGLEAGVGDGADGDAWAVGATAGVTGIADLLGVEPYLGGLTVGWPLAWSGLSHVDQTGWPEIYLRWGQEF